MFLPFPLESAVEPPSPHSQAGDAPESQDPPESPTGDSPSPPPSDATPPPTPPPPSPDFEWRRPQTWLEVAWGALSAPHDYYRGLLGARGLAAPLAFLFITQLIPALAVVVGGAVGGAGGGDGGGVPGWTMPVLLLSLAWKLAQALFMAATIYLVARHIMKSPLRLDQALRAFAYSGAVWVFSFAGLFLPPLVATFVLAAMLGVHFYLMMVGLVELGRMSMPLAAACQIIAMVVLFLVVVLLNQLGSPAPM